MKVVPWIGLKCVVESNTCNCDNSFLYFYFYTTCMSYQSNETSTYVMYSKDNLSFRYLGIMKVTISASYEFYAKCINIILIVYKNNQY
ncbi:hypothetical protein KUTeg_001763 [Tegillarca granosa]|uniref:Uncharacterized protein n=1 Tax=Tegillarca granosa TaxID=220873 RepID=A0ABQ9FTU7_TEGGR|nr:hypothetical protein KUTeg_001763 [Tegillarca granosa]